MPDNLSNIEIKEALECCADLNCNCVKCELYDAEDDDYECSRKLKLEAANAIHRLQAENERLRKSRDRWRRLAEVFDRIIRKEELVGDNDV